MLTIVAPHAAAPPGRVWGTGGWIPPADREVLDWLTLGRLLGWHVDVVELDESGVLCGRLPRSARVIVVAADPDVVHDETVCAIEAHAADPRLIVCRAARAGTRLAKLSGVWCGSEMTSARTVTWAHRNRREQWRFRDPVTLALTAHADRRQVWSTAGDVPLIIAADVDQSVVATVMAHPSELRDADPAGTALLKRLLSHGAPGAMAWLDWSQTLLLRMDDPGGAQNVYSRDWSYPKIRPEGWTEIGRDLASRNARMSLGYVSGWVDDGDAERGELSVDGRPAVRCAGAVHPSPAVQYLDRHGHLPGTLHDYTAEFAAIQALRRAGLVDVEMHGYTHMHPDRVTWVSAPDRFDTWPATTWFRELGPAAAPLLDRLPAGEHPISKAMELFHRFFGITPTTLIAPGDQWTESALERALDAGLQLVGSYYLAIREADRFCWCQHICAPYLNEPDPVWFRSELPVVGYFHDYEPAREGVGWITGWLDRWQSAGATRFIDYRELAAALTLRIAVDETGRALTVERPTVVPCVKPVPVAVKLPGAATTIGIRVSGAMRIVVPTCQDESGTCRVNLLPEWFGRVSR